MGSSSSNKKIESASWFDVLKRSLKEVLRIDRSQLTAFQAIRGTIGIIIPLALGVATGHVVEGVSMAGGAAVGLTTTSRVRTRTMLVNCIGVAISAFVGSVTGHFAWISVLVAGIWGFGAGMMVAISQPAMILGLQSTLVLIILTHFELDPAHAFIQATLMFAGALLQTLLAIVPSPWKNTSPERITLFSVYQKLADYAQSPSREQSEQQLRDALLKSQLVLADGNTQSQQGKIFTALFEEADHIRLSLLLLKRSMQQLALKIPEQTSVRAHLYKVMQSSVQDLRNIAGELKPSSPFTKSTLIKPHQRLKEALTALRQEHRTPDNQLIIQHALVYADALRDQLHQAKKLAKSWKYAHQYSRIAIRKVPRQAYLHLHNVQATLRANLTPRSTVFRHAMRLGVALALATVVLRLSAAILSKSWSALYIPMRITVLRLMIFV